MRTTQWRWQWQHAWMLPPLTIWICVSITLRYGYYGDSRILLGPASSRLMKTSSVFLKELIISNKDNNHVILHAFNQKPKLSSEISWTVSKFFLVEAYESKGITLWLNQGSTIRVRWEAHTTSSLDQLHGMVIKGGNKFELLQANQASFLNAIAREKTVNGKEAEYKVEGDDSYHIGVLNLNARNIILTVEVNVSAKVYDTTKAKNTCSTADGSCRLSLVFPNTQYVILTATNNSNGGGGSYVAVTLVVRVLVYIILLGFLMIVTYLILKFLGVYDGSDQNSHVTVDVTYRTGNVVATQTETEPFIRVETNQVSNETNEEEDDEDGASSSSSEELYDEKLCAICYDEQRNSFFVPCGHCATCYDCAQRITEGESKVCPICRRLVHKVRRLFYN